MDLKKMPPEILETIFLELDCQTLAACAAADYRMLKVVYSTHFLDAFSRRSLACSWITAQNIYDMEIPTSFEFWFWAYTTMKVEDERNQPIIFQNKFLTKIGTFQHMFIMWLTCGQHSSYLDSYGLMNVLYPLPETVAKAFQPNTLPKPYVLDTLMKLFYALPELLYISWERLKLFRVQNGSVSSPPMHRVYTFEIKPKLPEGFHPIFSVEIMCTACSGRYPALLILITKDAWVLWFGVIAVSMNDASVIKEIFCHCFSLKDGTSVIKECAQSSLECLKECILKNKDGTRRLPGMFPMLPSPCPIISGENFEITSLTISLAQEHNRSLQKKFEIVLDNNCASLMRSVKPLLITRNNKEIIQNLSLKHSHSNEMDAYVRRILHVDNIKIHLHSYTYLCYVVYTVILERIAYLFRNEILACIENSFCHFFLCGCPGQSFQVKNDTDLEQRIKKCLCSRIKDGLYCPLMWPPYVLSAACKLVPVLVDVLWWDIHLFTSGSLKLAIPAYVLKRTYRRIMISGLTLTNRPPNKPRCPPILKQIRLHHVDTLCK